MYVALMYSRLQDFSLKRERISQSYRDFIAYLMDVLDTRVESMQFRRHFIFRPFGSKPGLGAFQCSKQPIHFVCGYYIEFCSFFFRVGGKSLCSGFWGMTVFSHDKATL